MPSFGVLVLLIIGIAAKDLHIKEMLPTEKTWADENHFLDFYNYDEMIDGDDRERYARHVEMVTESVLEHLLTEIRNKYPKSINDSSNLPKLMHRLQMKLNRLNKKKHIKHKKAKFLRNYNSTKNNKFSTATTPKGANITKSTA